MSATGNLAAALDELARSLATWTPGQDVRAPLERARGLAKGWEERVLARVSSLVDGLDALPAGDRFARFDLALDAVESVRGSEEPRALLETIEKALAASGAAKVGDSPASGPVPAPSASAPTADPAAEVRDGLEVLAGEVVALSGPTDAAGLASIATEALALRDRVMKAGGGVPTLTQALEGIAAFAKRPGSGDPRAVLVQVVEALGEAANGDARAAKTIAQLLGEAPAPRPSLSREAGEGRGGGAPSAPPQVAAATAGAPAKEVTVALGGERAILDGFVVEAREHLANAETGLLQLEENPSDSTLVNALFRAFHSIKGVAGLLALGPVVRLTHALESLLDAARKGTRKLDRAGIDALLAARDVLAKHVDRVAAALERNASQATLEDSAPLVHLLEELLAGRPATRKIVAPPAQAPVAAAQPALPPTARYEIPTATVPLVAEPLPPVAAPVAPIEAHAAVAAVAPVAPPQASHGGGHSGVRVPMDRLDHLVALVGEMVISQAQVGHDLSSTDPDAPLAKETSRLGKITREVQDLSMTLRMLPVQPLFQKVQRLVRDLVRQTGKPVRLVTEGEETRLDKSVIDELEDPLVHMVRNAIDHGIESPEDRRKAGKPETGTVKIAARHAGGEVVIEIQDDGKGLDKDRILAKARERGLAPLDAAPPDGTIFGYVFEPGLSTAQKVTELSGRGVGMDVVKRNVQKLRGKIDITSQRGAGSTFTIRLPLTLAIIDGMIVRVGTERFTLPNYAIEEALQLQPGQLVTAYGKGEMVRIRGTLAPLVRLRRVFGMKEEPGAVPHLAIVVGVEKDRCAFAVDEIVGQQQIVIKSLEPPFNGVRGIGGATVLGDGRVGLILDVPQLVRLALDADAPAETREEAADEPLPAARPLDGQYLIAALGDEEYGLPILTVQEIVTMLPVTAIPLVPSFVRGLVNLRGHVIPVVDLRARLGMDETQPNTETCVVVIRLARRTLGLIVDSVREVLHLKRDATAATPRLGPGVRTDFIAGVGSAGDRIAFLLDVERVLRPRELCRERGNQ